MQFGVPKRQAVCCKYDDLRSWNLNCKLQFPAFAQGLALQTTCVIDARRLLERERASNRVMWLLAATQLMKLDCKIKCCQSYFSP